MKKNEKKFKKNIFKKVFEFSDKYFPQLFALAENGIYRSPLNYSLVVNYPPRPVAPKLGLQKQLAIKDIFTKIISSKNRTKISFYVHVPFCTRECTFCNFYKITGPAYKNKMEAYLNLLKKEVKLLNNEINNKVIITSLYFGGGTPCLLKIDQLSDILSFLKETFEFQDKLEITLEIHPEIIRIYKGLDKYFQTLKSLGVTRISIGLQSSNDYILGLTNRGHTVDEAKKVIKAAKKSGFLVNVDLLWGGLPYQTIETLYDSLIFTYSLRPDQITTYFVEIKPGSIEYTRYKEKPFIYPNWIECMRMQPLILEAMKKYDYAMELLHMFTKSKKKITFLQQKEKWLDENSTLLAIGPGTYNWIFKGYENNYVFYKYFSYKDYKKSLDKNILPIERAIVLDKNETIRRHIMYALNYGKIPTRQYKNWLKELSNDRREIENIVKKLLRLNLIKIEKENIEFSELGYILSDEIKSAFASNELLEKLSKIKKIEERRYQWFPDADLVLRLKKFLMGL
jgi:oxygen-independent coproporphyrinogen-3 oxidase